MKGDYQFHLDKLRQACDKHYCDIHAYVLMTNHVHLLIIPYKREGISKVIQCWDVIMFSISIILISVQALMKKTILELICDLACKLENIELIGSHQTSDDFIIVMATHQLKH